MNRARHPRPIPPPASTLGWLVAKDNSVVAAFHRYNDAAAPMAKFFLPIALREAEVDADQYGGTLLSIRLGDALRILARAGVKVLIVSGGNQSECMIIQEGGKTWG